MKKRTFFGMLAVSAIVFAMAMSTASTVGASSDVTVQWTDAPNIDIGFTSGDDAWTHIQGVNTSGTFNGSDHGDNPYSYGVDTVHTNLISTIDGGGYIDYFSQRNDSYEPMYGASGQESHSYVATSDTGSLAFSETTNYASMGTSNYGFQANEQFEASGEYEMGHRIESSDGDSASWVLEGEGSSTVNHMSDDISSSGFNFGKGAGCYTNAVVHSLGAGLFNLYVNAGNSITTDSGIHMDGGVLTLVANFLNSFDFSNFALSGN